MHDWTKYIFVMLLWFQNYGAYYITHRDQIIKEASMAFFNNNLMPKFIDTIEIVPFSELLSQIQGYDPRDIVGKAPREYPDAV